MRLAKRTTICLAVTALMLLAQPPWLMAAEPAAALADVKTNWQTSLDRMVEKFGLPGISVAYQLPDGKLTALTSGLADRETAAPMTPDTLLLAGSVGKTFVAAVALGLAQEGKLSLDDKIERWLGDEPWFQDLPGSKDITVRQLMMHRSGLADHANDLRFAAKVRQVIVAPGSDPDFYFHPAELIDFVLKKKPRFAPGEQFAYTDTGYIVLGLVIERAGGAPYYEQLQKRFLDPLGLVHTVPANRRDIAGIASGYLAPKNVFGLPEKTTKEGKLAFNPANEWTGGGLASTPSDLARWGAALYGGSALPGAYLDELVAAAGPDKDKDHFYGLGVFVDRTDLGLKYGHGGWFPGYLTQLAYYPDYGVAIAVQTNTDATRDRDLLVDVAAMTKELLEAVGKRR